MSKFLPLLPPRALRPVHATPLLRGVRSDLLCRSNLHIVKTQRYASTNPQKQKRLPVSYYRGGTSRAIIFAQHNLPADRTQWPSIFRGVMGSPDPNGRQLDGMGGGVSSLSKVCVVGKSQREDADVDYTFAAVGVKDDEVDFSSNCGNMTSAIGPYAVDTGMVGLGLEGGEMEGGWEEEEVEGGEDWVRWRREREGTMRVRIHNTNTGKIIHATFPVVDGEAAAEGDFAIDGVAGTGAKIELAFLDPAWAFYTFRTIGTKTDGLQRLEYWKAAAYGQCDGYI